MWQTCRWVAVYSIACFVPIAMAESWSGTSQKAMVASVHPLATQAGLSVMEQGGNAIDAAIATGLTLGVVDGYNSGLGGGCFILIRSADGTITAIDGREMAPSAAHRNLFLKDGKPDTSLSQTGALASGVPGALAAYDKALRKHGKLPLGRVILPAQKIAAEGFVIEKNYARKLVDQRDNLARFEGSKAVFFKADGELYQAGELLKQPDLAKTYQSIGEQGIDWFYRGPFAEQTAKWMAANSGIMTAADFAKYQAIERKPLITTYREHTIVGFPPPSSGGVHVAQMLNMLEAFDLAALHRDSEAKWMHVVGEAMKLAFADRAFWLGDPDYAKVPRGIIDKEYAKQLSLKIQLDHASPVDGPGKPPQADSLFFERHTTHIATADAEGNWVAMTQTVNTTFGSKVIVPGLGVVMNNEMDDFAVAPGVPNAFGLLGNEANEVAAGKRPLSSMSPTIVMKDNQPWLTVGAAGGPRIITQTLGLLLRRLDLQQPLPIAIAAPRLHHQWRPDTLLLSGSTSEATRKALQAMGHRVEATGNLAVVQAIERLPDGTFVGVHDPSVNGLASGR